MRIWFKIYFLFSLIKLFKSKAKSFLYYLISYGKICIPSCFFRRKYFSLLYDKKGDSRGISLAQKEKGEYRSFPQYIYKKWGHLAQKMNVLYSHFLFMKKGKF